MLSAVICNIICGKVKKLKKLLEWKNSSQLKAGKETATWLAINSAPNRNILGKQSKHADKILSCHTWTSLNIWDILNNKSS